jgi:hypothetical protein
MALCTTLCWGDDARIAVEGVTGETTAEIAARWGATVETGGRSPGDEPRLVVSGEGFDDPPPRTARAAPRVATRFSDSAVELTIGRHRAVLDPAGGTDLVEVSPTRRLDAAERELLIGAALGHLLARRGLAVLHACAFDCGGVGVIGLGESFGGKSTVAVASVRAGGTVVSDDLILAGLGAGGGVELRPLRTYWFLRGSTGRIVPTRINGDMWETVENGEPRWVIPRGGAEIIDRLKPELLWLLSVDRRLGESRIAEIDQAVAFAALVRASSPIFLSRHFPRERAALLPVLRALTEGCRGWRVRLGTRLLDEPAVEIERLIAESSRRPPESL